MPNKTKTDISKYERITIDKLNEKGCMNILGVFMEKVSREYVTALRNFRRDMNDECAREKYVSTRNFICSDYFCALTGLDGSAIADTIDRNYASTFLKKEA